jgi:hypothetical protein
VRVFVTLALVLGPLQLIERLDKVKKAKDDGLQIKKARDWGFLPSTLFTNYFVFASFVIPHTVSVFLIPGWVILRKSWDALWNQWGQSASVIVAVVSISHVGYLFIRLFDSQAMHHRVEVAEACRLPTDWATPKQTLWIWYPWKIFIQRSPFNKLKLFPPDSLLVDNSPVSPYDTRDTPLTEEEASHLWDELLLGFKINHKEGIIDYLKRNAPIDRSGVLEA